MKYRIKDRYPITKDSIFDTKSRVFQETKKDFTSVDKPSFSTDFLNCCRTTDSWMFSIPGHKKKAILFALKNELKVIKKK